jgi:hypothetical protein
MLIFYLCILFLRSNLDDDYVLINNFHENFIHS